MKIGETLYFDHQATTPVDPRVLEAMAPYFVEACGNPHSGDHILGWKAAQAVEEAAAAVAALVGADTDEIVFTSGATEANNLALLGVARRASGGRRRRLLISAIEHKSVLAVASALQQELNYRIEYIPIDSEGRIIFDDFIRLLGRDVLSVSIMAVNNEIGTIQDIFKLSRYVRDSGAIFHCDAAQAPCAMDMQDLANCADLLSLSAHKIYGPKGIGALYIRRDLKQRIEPLIYGGGQQQNLRSGTVPSPLCVGMGAAAKLLTGPNAEGERMELRRRRDRFVERLQQMSWPVHVNGTLDDRHPGNANVRFEGFSAHDILGVLQPHLAASTGSACTTGLPEPSHVLRAIGLSEEEADASIRFSLGRYTTDEDVDEAVGLVHQALSHLADAGISQFA